MRRYLWLLLLIAVLGAVLFANIGASESDGPNVDRCPVSASHMAWMDLCLGSIYYDNMTTAQKEADVARFYVGGQVKSRDWIESAKLFRASFLLAVKQPLGSKARKELLQIALKGAKRCLEQKPDTMVIALAPWRLKLPDKWFSRELIKTLASDRLQFEHEAIRAYSLSLLYELLGDKGAALMAMEDAYTLCPADPIIATRIRKVRTLCGDFSGALDAIQARANNHTGASLMSSLFSQAQDELDTGETLLASGDCQHAVLHLAHSWQMLKKLRSLKEHKRAVQLSTIDILENHSATGLGLIAIGRGDTEGALLWLKRSDAKGMWLEKVGYDLRLARKLSTVPSAKQFLITYLQKASSCGLPKSKEEAKRLLNQVQRANLVSKR